MEYIKPESQDALRNLLVGAGIDISKWGKGEAKTVSKLWNEIIIGESNLEYDKQVGIIRIIPGAVEVIIRKTGKILVETEQEFTDGRIRIRNNLPAEKMMPGESICDTAKRCLKEELRVEEKDIKKIVKGTYESRDDVKDSPSYPGLRTHYTFHTVEAEVEGLLETDFETTESDDSSEISVKRHRWVWKSKIKGLKIDLM